MTLTIHRLVWRPHNIAHIARHAVTAREVEEVCRGPFFAIATYAGRELVIGPTQEGRMLTVVLEPLEPGVYFPVTARPASRKERQRYAASQLGDNL